jgi:hypothetical protein
MHFSITLANDQLDAQIYYAKQTKQIYKYKHNNIKIKLYKNIEAIWYTKSCRIKQLTL